MFNNSTVIPSASGVAEAKQLVCSGDEIQVAVKRVTTGTGTATITVKPGTDTEYQSIVDGTITMSAPVALIIKGRFNAVLCTSSQSSDVYELEVMS